MFEVTLVHFDHSGRTKDYDILLIERDDLGRAVMVQRWGRTGTAGQFKADTKGSRQHVATEYIKAEKYRQERGYFKARTEQFDFPTWDDLRNSFYGYSGALQPDILRFITEAAPDVEAIKAAVAEERTKEITKTCGIWGTW